MTIPIIILLGLYVASMLIFILFISKLASCLEEEGRADD
jgi:hypothetical protein